MTIVSHIDRVLRFSELGHDVSITLGLCQLTQLQEYRYLEYRSQA